MEENKKTQLRLFISQKMDGLSEEEILKRRHVIIDLVRDYYKDQYIVPINSYVEQDPPKDVHPGIWYLAKSLDKLATADIAFFDEGCEGCRGCRMEYFACTNYGGIKILQGEERDGKLWLCEK